MNILMIGGTGVLSGAVAAEAIRRGFDITMINRGLRHIPKGIELIKSDRNDFRRIAKALNGRQFDAVMDYLCMTDAETTKSFEFYKKYTAQYFFISSCAVYDTSKGGVMSEDSPKVLPIWSYSVNKWASEQHLMKLANGTGVNYTIIRPCVTYGDTRIPYGISPEYRYHYTLCARALAGKPIIRWNKGKNRCNMTRVEDFAVGVVGLIGNPKAYNEAFNVCGDETPTQQDVLDVIGESLGIKVPVIDIPKEFYAQEMPHRAGELLGGRCIDAINSNNKIKAAVPDFRQTIFIKEGVRKTIEAYKVQNYQLGIDWRFDADTDRIIAKYCRRNRIDATQYRLGFTDYLGNATFSDKRQYWMEYHKRNLIIRSYIGFYHLSCRVTGKVKRVLKYIFGL